MKVLIYSLLLFLIVGVPNISFSQITEGNTANKAAFLEKAKHHEITPKMSEYLYRHKVDVAQFDQFKAEGIDLKHIGSDYKWGVLYSPVIVRGKVTKRTYNSSNDVKFHTSYVVTVEEVIKSNGYQLNGEITLKLISGPVGEYYGINSMEDKLFLGEEVIVYLEPIERTFEAVEEVYAMRGQSELAEKAMKRINADRNDKHTFQLMNKYSIRSNYVFDDNRVKLGTLETVKSEIQNVMAINGQEIIKDNKK